MTTRRTNCNLTFVPLRRSIPWILCRSDDYIPAARQSCIRRDIIRQERSLCLDDRGIYPSAGNETVPTRLPVDVPERVNVDGAAGRQDRRSFSCEKDEGERDQDPNHQQESNSA